VFADQANSSAEPNTEHERSRPMPPRFPAGGHSRPGAPRGHRDEPGRLPHKPE
jgi:hypothetical protein